MLKQNEVGELDLRELFAPRNEEETRKAFFNSSYSHPLFAVLMAKYPYDKAVEIFKETTGFGVVNAQAV